MGSILAELQRDALDSSISVADLLRKAYVVARKLKVVEFQQWIDWELNGYKEMDKVPDYREVGGQLKAFNPYNGYIPIVLEDTELAAMATKRKMHQAIGEFEKTMAEAKGKKSSFLLLGFPKDAEQFLMRGFEYPLTPQLAVDFSQIHKILEIVRNTILNWTLQLEEDGIMGEGMSFNEKEKEIAQRATYTTINNHIGVMNNSQLQQHTSKSTQSQTITTTINIDDIKQLLESLKPVADKIEDQEVRNEFLFDIQTIERQVNSPNARIGVIKESLKSVRNIMEGIGASLVASGIWDHLNHVISTIGNQ